MKANKNIQLVIMALVFGVGLLGTVNSAVALSASSSLTIVNVSNWKEEICKSPRTVRYYDVTEYLYDSHISSSHGVYYRINPGNTFDGGYARLWAFWSDNGGVTYNGLAWDYTSNSATFKHATGYGTGNNWVGQMISTICDQSQCYKDPHACNGKQRSNINFVAN